MSTRLSTWIILGLIATAACGAVAEMKTFSDSFDGDLSRWGEVRGQWRIEDGVLVHGQDWDSQRLAFPETEIGDFRLDYRLRFDRIDPALRAGLVVGRGEGTWMIILQASGNVSWSFNVAGERSGMFRDGMTARFRAGEWSDVSVRAERGRLTVAVDGQTALVGPAAGGGALALQLRREMAADDVKLAYAAGAPAFANRQLNGSFEHATNPDVPDYWALPTTWTRMNKGLPLEALPEGRMEAFRENWMLDPGTAFDGKASLRVRHPLGAAGMPMLLKPGTNDYVVSVYLKSDRDSTRVRLAADFENRDASVAERIVEVGREWRRETLLVPAYDRNRLAVSVMPQEEGFVWIDAVQIEAGRVATAWAPSWYDAGFTLPHNAAHVEPPEYPDKTHAVSGPASGISVGRPTLSIQDVAAPAFALDFGVANASTNLVEALVTTTVEVEGQEPFVATRALRLESGATATVSVPRIPIPNDRFRCRVIHTITAADGSVIRRERRFLDVPQPLRVYPEFSHYTEEKTARFMVRHGLPESSLEGAVLECELRLAIQRSETYGKRTFPVESGARRQWVELPLLGNGWMHETPYEVVVRLLDAKGRELARARCDLKTLPPAAMDVRVNHVNRGLYVNGEPYIPYGAYFTGALPDLDQLRGYRALGFDFVAVVGHRSRFEALEAFLANCEQAGLRACITQLSRKYGISAPDLANRLRDQPALVLFNPVDETGQPNVYELVDAVQHRLPHIPCFVNENSAGYQAFNRQMRGFPGPILSCDRYPLIGQPYGWPQTSTDVNGIYSFEERIEWMDADGERDRKPLHFYLQAAEHFSREPTVEELTWMTYIPLVNHCLAFTYFDGIPHSRAALDAMAQLNREVQSLKPALFSTEEEPRVVLADGATRRNIRVLAKQVADEITLVCVNRSLQPVDAVFDLTAAGVDGATRVNVLFEERTLLTGTEGRLADRFEPLARHVYRIHSRKTKPALPGFAGEKAMIFGKQMTMLDR